MTDVECKDEFCTYNINQRCKRVAIVLDSLHFPAGAMVECLSAVYRKEKADEEAKQTYFKAEITD
jgi:hypothetical protein